MSEQQVRVEPMFTPMRPVAAEGARIGIVTCLRCGAAVVLDPGDGALDPVALHATWHGDTASDD